jgi:hypothetical protein
MPVTIAKRFIVDFPFSAGPQGPLDVTGRVRVALLPGARKRGKAGKSRAKLAVGYWMQPKFYLLQQILFSFCELKGLQGEVPSRFC